MPSRTAMFVGDEFIEGNGSGDVDSDETSSGGKGYIDIVNRKTNKDREGLESAKRGAARLGLKTKGKVTKGERQRTL